MASSRSLRLHHRTASTSSIAVFLDRDGTLINEPSDGRIVTSSQIRLTATASEALAELARCQLPVVIVTNQAGISEGRLTATEFWALQEKVDNLLAPTGIELLGTYVCPHVSADGCNCRKPKPGLVLQAAESFRLDRNGCWMVGNECSDIVAGRATGMWTVLIRPAAGPPSCQADFVTPTLLAAAQLIARRSRRSQGGCPRRA